MSCGVKLVGLFMGNVCLVDSKVFSWLVVLVFVVSEV